MPQMTLTASLGLKNVCSWISPKPLYLTPSGPGKLSRGTMARLIKVHFRDK